jgi:hypothetical protein
VADTVSEQPLPKREERALVIARRKAEAKVPRHRFGIAYLLLAALLGAAVGLSVVFVSEDGRGGGQKWSAWKPTEGGVQGFDQIAKTVGREYALPSGRQLVGVLSTPPVVQGQGNPVPLRAIAVRTGLAGETTEDASFYGACDAWAYVLCGFGTSCAIAEGKPSAQRYDLLRREALELALYTMKYMPIDNVLVFFPPATRKAKLSLTLFFHRKDLQGRLDHPLRSTLPQAKPPVPGKITVGEQQTVDALTGSSVYRFITIGDAPGYGRLLVVQPAA